VMAFAPDFEEVLRVETAPRGTTRVLLARNVSPTTPPFKVERWFHDFGVETVWAAGEPGTGSRKVRVERTWVDVACV